MAKNSFVDWVAFEHTERQVRNKQIQLFKTKKS